MSLLDITGLAYLAVGLLLAAAVYGLFMGDYNPGCDDPNCDVHGKVNKEASGLVDDVQLMLDSPARGPVAFALTLGLVAVITMWPIIIPVVLLKARNLRGDL